MAEAAAVVGLLASIASLVDLSAKVVIRLREFTSKSSDVPESFRSLWVRLPLLTVILQNIQSQAEAGHLLDSVEKVLKPVVDDTFEQVLAVQTFLSKVLPPGGASKLERAMRALQSLAKEDKIQQAMGKIDKNNAILMLHQMTRHVDTGNLILAQLTELTMNSKLASMSSGKDELSSLARANEKTLMEELPLQIQLMLSNNNRGLYFGFLQLLVPSQRKFIHQQERQLIQFVEQEEEAKVLEFLTAFDTRKRLADQGRPRVEGSCDWVLKSSAYLEWVHGKCNRLNMFGKPGTGKTVATAFIAEFLNDGLKKEDVLAVYACSFRDPQIASTTRMLCALAAQIAQSSPASMEKCKRFLERNVSNGKLEPKILDLQDLIVEMSLSPDIHRIFIVIDGLDEVGWEHFDQLMCVVEIPQSARKVKMLLTSRRDPLIGEALQGYSTLSMDKAELQAALITFIDSELKHSKFADLPQQDLDEIKESIIRRSNGMFLHAQMAISLLSESYYDAPAFQHSKEALFQDVPHSLKELYD